LRYRPRDDTFHFAARFISLTLDERFMQPRSSLPYAALTAVLLLAASVRAQPSDSVTAEAARLLYEKAKSEIIAGEIAQACLDFETAKKLLPNHIRTRISLAECYVKLGRPATASFELSIAKTLADIEGDKGKVDEIDKRLTEVQPTIPTLTISVPNEVSTLAGLTITRNGTDVPRALWGQPIPVDFGLTTIEATALGKSPWSMRIDIDKSNQQFTAIVTPHWTSPTDSVDDGRQTQAQTPIPLPNNMQSNPPVPQWNQPRPVYGPFGPVVDSQPAAPVSKVRYVGIAGMAVGGASLAVGLFVGESAISHNRDSNDGHCRSDDHCDNIGYDLRKDARTLGNVSTGLFIAGGVFLVGGIIIFSTAPRASTQRPSNAPQTTRVDLRMGFGHVGFGGVF
jgi:hypothetical protein